MTLSTAPPAPTAAPTMAERSANIRTMLDQAVSPRKKPRLLTRETYLERLQTFSSKTYFGKPIGLSPIVCAARGWSNVGTDLLECSHCRAKVCVAFDAKLLPSQHKKVEQHYKEQLRTKGHITNPQCLFYSKKESDDDDDGMPLYLAAVLDDEFIAWMDHPTPQTVLLEHAQQLTNLTELEELPEEDDADQKLIDQVCDKLIVADGDDTNDSAPTNNKTAVTLSLLGWTRCGATSTESKTTLDCKLCLSTLPETTTNRRLAMRAHKYYCPYRCGMTDGGEPCWKLIANKALKSLATKADQEGDDNYQGADATLRRIEILLAQHNNDPN